VLAAIASSTTPPDLKPLFQALAQCGVDDAKIPQVTRQLVRPPLTFRPDPTRLRGFDRDMAARLLCVDENRPDPHATWKSLSRAERKRARRSRDWLARDHGLSATPQGRPPIIDAALVLYCIRVLCEASGRPRFKFSRPPAGGLFGGPMWRALNEALPLAQRFLEVRFGTPAIPPNKIDNHAEAIAGIAKLTRSRQFEKRCRLLGLGPRADDVARNAATFRLAIAKARKPWSLSFR
jgi:hypothetical protein